MLEVFVCYIITEDAVTVLGCGVCQIGMNLLVTEARLEAVLIYGLNAINRNMNS